MEDELLSEFIKHSVEDIITGRVEEEIDKKVKDFRYELESRKDNYIAEIMKAIRIYHERDQFTNGINYRIVFENITRLEERRGEYE